jgi:hypothetical protein
MKISPQQKIRFHENTANHVTVVKGSQSEFRKLSSSRKGRKKKRRKESRVYVHKYIYFLSVLDREKRRIFQVLVVMY